MKPKKKARLWKDGEIPARLFFKILETQDLCLLKRKKGKAGKGTLQKNWSKIYDEYFELRDDPRLRIIVEVQLSIVTMLRRAEIARHAVRALSTAKFDDEQMCDVIEGLKSLGFSFDMENPLDSILKILKNDIPALETRIELEKETLDNLTKGVASTFEESCVAYESWGFKIEEDCSLRRYVAYEKAAKQKAVKQKKDGTR